MLKQVSYVAAVFVVVLTASAALAQRDAGSKIRGDAYSVNAGSMYQSHAYDHARVLSDYATSGKTVPKAVVKEHSDAIRANIAAAKKANAGLSEEAKKEVAKSLAAIEKAHAKVLESCNMLDECCATGDGDSTTVMTCCKTVAEEMKAAKAEQDKLAKQLKLDNKAPDKK